MENRSEAGTETVEWPPRAVAYFEAGNRPVYVIPHDGEEPADAVVRIAEKHGFDPATAIFRNP